MKLLTVPNWSFGRDRRLLGEVRDLLEAPFTRHFAESDVDHNRTVTAFSGAEETVFARLMALAEVILPAIDLNRHMGVHPRIGALDVCPFIVLGGAEAPFLAVDLFAQRFAERFEVPVYLYEASERGRHASDLPSLRKGGFGGLLERKLAPDFGPDRAHPQWGVTVIGVRRFLLAMNVDLAEPDPRLAQEISAQMRRARVAGDVRFSGVRALGFPLASRGLSQVSLNLTEPDRVSADALVEWVEEEARRRGTRVVETELIGVIRPRDLEHATRFRYRPEQVVADEV